MDRDRCPSPEALRAFVRGDLEEAELDDLAGHLERCGACTEAVARLDDEPDPILDEVRRRVVESAWRGLQPGDSGSTVLRAGAGVGIGEPGRLGDFRLVREVGRGGMGIVYEAFQGSLNRQVALKVLREPADLARFRREARAAGRLHHTNIVPVYGVGHDDGCDYLVMQYIDGRGLDRVLRGRPASGDGREPPAPAFDHREAARIVLQAAEAVASAHAQGVVHRDIKPSNILLDARGHAWVTDFGLASDDADPEALTRTGDVFGTLRYMAPERFWSRGDARGDIYGLGITLYELATGRPAFADSDRAVLVNRVLNEAPARPRQVNPRLSRNLETIILRAMAREPSRRYATADAMAEDLRRLLDDRPIRARRAGPWERASRGGRRNPLAAGLLAGLVVVFLSGFAAVTVLWRRARVLAVAEATARADESRLRARAQAEVAARDFDRGLDLARRGEADLGMLWMAETLREAPAEDPAISRVIRANLSAWAGAVPRLRAILDHGGNVVDVAFRPDGGAVLTGSHDGTARAWDATTGRPLGQAIRFGGRPRGIAFSPDGHTLLVITSGGDGTATARLWDVHSGRPASPGMAHPAPIYWGAIALSPDGERVATGCEDGTVRVWDASTGRPLGPSRSLRGAALAVAFDRGGRTLTAVDAHGLVRSWALPPTPSESVARLVDRIRARAGIELDDTKDVEVLEPQDWRRARVAVIDLASAEPGDDGARHEACARDAEAIGEGFAARWHLDRLIAARPGDGMLHARRARARLWDGDLPGADDDLDRAIAMGPRVGVLDWLMQRAADSLAEGRPADAIRLLDRDVAARPVDWLARALRADALAALGRSDDCEADLAAAIERGADIPFLARLAASRARAGRWAEAAALYDRAIALGTVPYEVWTQAAIAHLEIGDEAGYGRICGRMRGRHPAAIPEARVRARLATVLTLGPGGVGDDGKGMAWMASLPADVGVSRKPPRRWALQVLGALLYCEGRPAEAIGRLLEGMATGDGRPDFEEAAFLAMAYHRAGDRARAREAPGRLAAGDPDEPSSEGWWASAARRLLAREAIRVVLDGDLPGEPFGP